MGGGGSAGPQPAVPSGPASSDFLFVPATTYEVLFAGNGNNHASCTQDGVEGWAVPRAECGFFGARFVPVNAMNLARIGVQQAAQSL